jgi:hypothetical protein
MEGLLEVAKDLGKMTLAELLYYVLNGKGGTEVRA